MIGLHSTRSGQGRPVVLIHGGFLDHRMWSAAHEALSATHDVISYDVRGAGRSSRAPVEHAPSEDLVALLDELDLAEAALIGLSMGARIALEVAAARPERVCAVVACSLALPEYVTGDCDGQLPAFVRAVVAGDTADATERFARMWFDGRRAPDSVDRAARAELVELVDLGFAATLAHQRWRTLDELGLDLLDTPTLFVTGADDWPDIARTAAGLAARMPRARAVSLDGAAHTLNLDRPDAFLALVDGFLARGW